MEWQPYLRVAPSARYRQEGRTRVHETFPTALVSPLYSTFDLRCTGISIYITCMKLIRELGQGQGCFGSCFHVNRARRDNFFIEVDKQTTLIHDTQERSRILKQDPDLYHKTGYKRDKPYLPILLVKDNYWPNEAVDKLK